MTDPNGLLSPIENPTPIRQNQPSLTEPHRPIHARPRPRGAGDKAFGLIFLPDVRIAQTLTHQLFNLGISDADLIIRTFIFGGNLIDLAQPVLRIESDGRVTRI